MAALSKILSANFITWLAIGISLAAAGFLFTFPANPIIWQAATWILVTALTGLLMLVLVLGYTMATIQAARTWQRMATFLAGLACLLPVAVGLL
jgi:hypothetical protein